MKSLSASAVPAGTIAKRLNRRRLGALSCPARRRPCRRVGQCEVPSAAKFPGSRRAEPGAAIALRWGVAKPRSAQLRVVCTAFLRQRPLVTLPAMVANLTVAAVGGAPRSQLTALAVGFS